MFGTTTIHKRDQPALHLPATGDVMNRSMKRFSSPQPTVCRPLSPGLGIRNRWCTILDREKAYAIGKSARQEGTHRAGGRRERQAKRCQRG
ncbi:hypothetical protein Hsero_0167 [Herbaspirillum seropedicae SmR1]|uniref:Uncharacterized protein n=1 Tax=Herbaspirillum seropedicae (strain SmR1) TaxID=757424 RepID=D8IUX4_HERSS|nr:hypothetical protein Hsero_0167 [Herbaspirillum seropedicae SmR1]